MLVLLLKSGFVRYTAECAINFSGSSSEEIINKSKKFEDFAEK